VKASAGQDQLWAAYGGLNRIDSLATAETHCQFRRLADKISHGGCLQSTTPRKLIVPAIAIALGTCSLCSSRRSMSSAATRFTAL
jgi:hypothetical protein